MASELDLMLFEQHLDELRALPQADRWTIKCGDDTALEVYVDLHPRTAPQEHYRARLRWRDYARPFSLKFIDMETGGDTNPRSWPNFEGSRPGSFFVCLPFTEEGNGYHPDWAGSKATAYITPENPLQYAVLTLQHLLDNTYAGRGQP